ncbi:MAG TPA: PAS domain S-box protein [Pirellulales bacterium]|nr:PAS domain S-box protein [Pirellulales bacterium]
MRDLLRRADADHAPQVEKLRLVLDSIPNGIVMIDREGRMVLVNTQTEAMFGYRRAELLGRPVEVLMPERFREKHPEQRRGFFANPEMRSMGAGRDLYGRRKDGREFSVEIGLNLVQTDEGLLVLSTIVDLTARKRAEADVRQLNENLERRVLERTAELDERNAELSRSNQELDDFAHITSHDLKEPLRGIHNYAAFLAEDYAALLDDEGRAKLATIGRLTQRMEALINSLLETSRVGRAELVIQETDLNELLAEALDLLRISLNEAKVEVRVAAPLPTLRCDRTRIGAVLQNLLTNALKYNDKPRKWIEIGAAPAVPSAGAPAGAEPPQIAIYVRDNGIGIREKHLDAVFRIFKRLNARDEFGGGTGAGLAIAKKIVDRHGGRIWVESEFGEGSCFFFTLSSDGRAT